MGRWGVGCICSGGRCLLNLYMYSVEAYLQHVGVLRKKFTVGVCMCVCVFHELFVYVLGVAITSYDVTCLRGPGEMFIFGIAYTVHVCFVY